MGQYITGNQFASGMTQVATKLNQKIDTKFTEVVDVHLDYQNIPESFERFANSPVGSIIPYAGSTTPHDYLYCDGTVYNITDYPELSKHIRTQFGTYNYFGGDDGTTFAVPNLIGAEPTPGVNFYIKCKPTICVNTGAIVNTPNPLTTEPLEYAVAKITSSITTTIAADTKVVLDTIDGNMLLDNGAIKLTAGKTYNIKSIFSIDAVNTTGFYCRIVNYETGDVIASASCCPSTLDSSNRVSANYCETLYTPSSDIYITVLFSANISALYNLLISVQEIRNNPVNQYGGFQTEVLFEGSLIDVGEYNLSDYISNYNLIIVETFYDKQFNDATPAMTSATTPTPYVITASGTYSGYEPYKAFNKTETSLYDAWLVESSTGWLRIDTGKNTYTDGVFLKGRNDGVSTKNFKLQGSYDENIWVDIFSETDQIPSNGKTYSFSEQVDYRYYQIIGSPVGSYMSISRFDLKVIVAESVQNNLMNVGGTPKIMLMDNSVIILKDDKIICESLNNKISRIIGIRGQLPSVLSGGEF